MQALKRKKKLTFAEQKQIIELREVHKKSKTLECAFHILLDNKAEFEVLFNKLDEDVAR